jgi:hypothetical protein
VRPRLPPPLYATVESARSPVLPPYLTISGLDRVTDPAKATRLRGRIHAAARAAAERRPTTCNTTGTAITIGISGTDAADRIAALRSALASLAAKHDWTLTDDPPT